MFFKPDSIKDFLLHLLAIIFVAVILLYALFNWFLPDVTRHGETISVPDIQGHKVSELNQVLEPHKLRYFIHDSTFIPDTLPNIVISQHPKPESEVKENRKIYITVTSKYPPKVEMPNLKDKPLSTARNMLESAGLRVGEVRYKKNEFPVVLEQHYNNKEVQPGRELPKASYIDITVGSGLEEVEEDTSNNR